MQVFKKITSWIQTHELVCSIIFIILLALLAFLPSAGRAGFYGDDYHMTYGAYTTGPEKIYDSYMIDRPGAGLVLAFLYRLFGLNIHFYQALVIVLDIAMALSAFWLVRKVWPNQKSLALPIAAMMVVYPGFTDFLASFNYSLMLISVSFYVFSICLTVLAVQSRKRFSAILLIILAIVLSLVSVFVIEYYLALEILRVGIIVIVTMNDKGAKSQRGILILTSLKRYTPYLIAAAGFFIWRFFFFSSERQATNLDVFVNLFTGSPFYKVASLGTGLINNLLKITIFAWFEPVYRYLDTLRLRDLMVCGGIGLAGAVLFYVIYRSQIKSTTIETDHRKEGLQMILLGLLTVLVTSLPIVFVSREANFIAYGRYTLSGMIGGIMLLAALIAFYAKSEVRGWLFAFLIFSGIVTQTGVGINLASDWQASKDLWWQFAWRAPSLKPETVLTGYSTEYAMQEGFNMWGPANMIYYPESDNPVISAETLNRDFLQAVVMDIDLQRDFRTYLLNFETNNLLVFSVPSETACLHLINGDAPDYSSDDAVEIQYIGGYSRLDQVDVNAEPASPPAVFFGSEPAHGWCYYYQKADLAAQQGDFAKTLALYNQADQAGLHPNDQVELLPFILASAQTGDLQTLQQLLPMFLDDAILKVRYCANLEGRNYNISEEAHQLLFSMTCSE